MAGSNKRERQIVGPWHQVGPLAIAPAADDYVAVRGKGRDDEEVIAYFPRTSWQEFIDGIKNGEFELPADKSGS